MSAKKMIPIADPVAPFKDNLQEMQSILDRVISSGAVVLGPEVSSFEGEFAESLSSQRKVVSCANGTDAIYLALASLQLKPLDKVATAANAGFYSSSAISRAGLSVKYYDVDVLTGEVSLPTIDDLITLDVKVIIVTHLFGQLHKDIEIISQKCKANGVMLIEDCAQCQGASLNGRVAGTFGDLSTFSFYPSKNLGALGDGGAVSSDNPELIERIRRLRQYGWGEKYLVTVPGGINSRLDEIQAAFLRLLLPRLTMRNQLRREIGLQYQKGILNSNVTLPSHSLGLDNVFHLFVVRVQKSHRQHFIDHLKVQGIGSGIHYPYPDHMAFGNLNAEGELPNTEARAQEILSLPIFPELSETDVGRVIETVNTWKPCD